MFCRLSLFSCSSWFSLKASISSLRWAISSSIAVCRLRAPSTLVSVSAALVVREAISSLMSRTASLMSVFRDRCSFSCIEAKSSSM
ncbi:hypothetical protein FKM82_018236 [Ascaphus truei]